MKLRPHLYLETARLIIDAGFGHCCPAIALAAHEQERKSGARTRASVKYGTEPEVVFFQHLFTVGGDYPSATFRRLFREVYGWGVYISVEEERELRLMALALAHTLALEHNKGKFHL
jgi:hypothetical protein